MIGIERVLERCRTRARDAKMRTDAVITTVNRILVQAIVDEVNRGLQKMEDRLRKEMREMLAGKVDYQEPGYRYVIETAP